MPSPSPHRHCTHMAHRHTGRKSPICINFKTFKKLGWLKGSVGKSACCTIYILDLIPGSYSERKLNPRDVFQHPHICMTHTLIIKF